MSNWGTIPHLMKRKPKPPTSSWWTEATPDGFTDRAARATQLPDSRTVEGAKVTRVQTQFNAPRIAREDV